MSTLTDDQIRNLPPGAELDALVAEAKGWHRDGRFDDWFAPCGEFMFAFAAYTPSTDWAVAGPLLEEITPRMINPVRLSQFRQGWHCRIRLPDLTCCGADGTTGPHAIAIAYVLWRQAQETTT